MSTLIEKIYFVDFVEFVDQVRLKIKAIVTTE